MVNRRKFIQQSFSFAGLMLLSPYLKAALKEKELEKLVILHTNDMHSHIDPFPANDPKFPGQGGMAKRAQLVQSIRDAEEHVLLLDSGDIFQGTPYFNVYGGEVELKAMSAMHYDVSTLGNHDFDNGLEGFKKMLPFASFPFVNSNYDFSDTILNKDISKYKIIKKGGIKIGIFGLGVELEGLVLKKLYGNTQYSDPIKAANTTAHFLKHEKKCDLIICLSHLGYKYEGQNKVSDCILAAESENIDLILGGHTHTFLDQPIEIKNKAEKMVLINQVGWAGLRLGKIEIIFNKTFEKSALLGNWNYFQKKNMLVSS